MLTSQTKPIPFTSFPVFYECCQNNSCSILLVPFHDSLVLSTCVFSAPPTLDCHTPSTTSPQPLSASHISSNLFFFSFVESPILLDQSKSEVVLSTWCTFVSGNSKNHSCEATALSNLSQIENSSCQCLLQVNI